MIALIKFEKTLFIPIVRAKELKLKHETGLKLGRRSGNIELMDYNLCTYIDELKKCEVSEKEGSEETKTVYKNSKGNIIDSYYRYERVKDSELLCMVKHDDGHMVDLEYFALNCEFPFMIIKTIQEKNIEDITKNMKDILNVVEQKTKVLKKITDGIDLNFNEKCEVHVGGGLMTTFNDLTLKENCCSDELQIELNNGWRIIACCVQPDQRRPDYILGRYNSQLNVYDKNGAGR